MGLKSMPIFCALAHATQPLNWSIEMAQFVLSAYYLLGGAYSMQLDSHVRMDLLYGRLSPRFEHVARVFD